MKTRCTRNIGNLSLEDFVIGSGFPKICSSAGLVSQPVRKKKTLEISKTFRKKIEMIKCSDDLYSII